VLGAACYIESVQPVRGQGMRLWGAARAARRPLSARGRGVGVGCVGWGGGMPRHPACVAACTFDSGSACLIGQGSGLRVHGSGWGQGVCVCVRAREGNACCVLGAATVAVCSWLDTRHHHQRRWNRCSRNMPLPRQAALTCAHQATDSANTGSRREPQDNLTCCCLLWCCGMLARQQYIRAIH
jgi:hypothetical protein